MTGVMFADVELWATTYMRAALTGRAEAYATGVTVSNRVPNPRPARLVQFRRDGGPQTSPVFEVARLGVNVWAATEQDGANLAALVRALLDQTEGTTTGGRSVKDVTTTGPSSVPEADAAVHKYFTATVMVRGTAL